MDTAPELPPHPPNTKKCNKIWCKRLCDINEANCDTCREGNKKAQRKRREKAQAPQTTRKRKASTSGTDIRPTTRLRTDPSEDGTQTRGDAEEGVESESEDDMRGDEYDDRQVC
jgi:hypothetical protein